MGLNMRWQLVAVVLVLAALGVVVVTQTDNGSDTPADHVVQRATNIEIDITPSDPEASEQVRQTLARLAHYSSDVEAGILSGQNVGHSSYQLDLTYRQTWTKLKNLRELPTPSVMTMDIGADKLPKKTGVMLMLLSEHIRNGGMVGMSMHPPNPWSGGSHEDCRGGLFESLITPGRQANERWMAWLEGVGDILEALQRKRVTVLWRPLHESNGDWFWWCVGGDKPALTPDQYRQLWRETYRYLQEERKLHNLLWVYCVNVKTGPEIVSMKPHYPGREYVDIAALDYYGPDLKDLDKYGCYEQLRSFGKVVAIAEFGSKPMDGMLDANTWLKNIKNHYPHFAYFCSWHSWPKCSVALADLEESPVLLNSDFVINRDEIDWSSTD